MSIYKTRGIIIKRTNLGEADRLITIYSEKFGKIRTIAKGIRKIKSHLSGNLELFCLSNLNIAEGRNLDIICGAVIEKCYFNLRNKYLATSHAHYFSELVDKLTEGNDPHPEIFLLLDNVLENLDGAQSEILIPYFELNILTELGYHPELYHCIKCRKKITEEEKIYFSFERGGVVCGKDQKNDLKVSATAIKLLRLFLKHQITVIEKIKLGLETLAEVKKITRVYLNQTSEKDFKSQGFLK